MIRFSSLAGALSALLFLAQIAAGADSVPVFEMERYFTAPSSQKVDPPLTVGDMIRFRWIGEKKPPGSTARVAPLAGAKPLSAEGWEIYAHPKDDPTSAFSVIPLKPGDLTLPELQLEDADGRVVGKTRSTVFKVAPISGAEGSENPPEFVPPLSAQFPVVWLWISGVAFLVGGAALGYWLWRRNRRKQAALKAGAIKSKIVLSEHEEALARLEKLERESWVQRGETKKHYFGISEVLKHYVERRFGFAAAEQTTREMLQGLSAAGASKNSVEELSKLFESLDQVKFTDYRPEPGSSEPKEVLELARGWIKVTRRKTEAAHAP